MHVPGPSRHARRLVVPAVALAVLLVVAGCSTSSDTSSPTTSPGRAAAASAPSTSTSTTTTAKPKTYTLTSDPRPGATDVAADHTVTISSKGAAIREVTVTTPSGELEGAVSPEATSWTSSSGLLPATRYAVTVQVEDGHGVTSTDEWTFTTAKAAKVFRAILRPGDDAVVGVGMPVIVTLNAPIPPARRASLEQRLTVSARPAVTGAWHWFSSTELHWRPETFWAPHTAVDVTADLAGFDAGDGAFAAKNVHVHYTIGDSHISLVDATTHRMGVFTNGELVRGIKVSTGSAKYPTHSGVHVVTERRPKTTMDSATVGIPRNSPDGYYETVLWDVRISNSGEFVHAAPWSASRQGRANVSHGCVNVSTADGEWFFNYSQIGDVVQVVGTPLQLQPTNGLGDWQVPWAQWAD